MLWHEIGHDILHRQEAVAAGGFKEFNIFDMRENRMEYEANILLLRLRSLMTPSWSILKTATTFSKLQEQ